MRVGRVRGLRRILRGHRRRVLQGPDALHQLYRVPDYPHTLPTEFDLPRPLPLLGQALEGSYAHPYLPKPDGKRLRYEDLVADDAGLVALPVEANVKRVA